MFADLAVHLFRSGWPKADRPVYLCFGETPIVPDFRSKSKEMEAGHCAMHQWMSLSCCDDDGISLGRHANNVAHLKKGRALRREIPTSGQSYARFANSERSLMLLPGNPAL